MPTAHHVFFQERPPTSSIMLSSKKSDAGSSSSSSSASSAGGDRAPTADAQTGTAAPTAGAMDVKKEKRSSPSVEPGGAPVGHHQGGPGPADPDSAEVRRTSRRKRAKVNILGFCSLYRQGAK